MTTVINTSDVSAKILKKNCSLKDWIYFPEIKDGLPLLPREIIKLCPTIEGKIIVTTSEYIILWFLREVRHKKIKPNDLLIFLHADIPAGQWWEQMRLMEIDEEGEFKTRWPNGFFTERAALLFD